MAGQRKDKMELRTLILLKKKGLSNRKVAQIMNINRKTVDSYIKRFQVLELDHAELLAMDDAKLHDLFTEDDQTEKIRYEHLSSQFSKIQNELKRPGATLQTIWQNYLLDHPDGYRYTQFTTHYRKWRGKVKASGKLEHKAGEKLFVDFTGKKMSYMDRITGEVIPVEIFVAVYPCSQYTFVKAVASQKREDFIDCLESCLQWSGGVPQAIVSDNLKSAVSKGSKYAPEINKTLADFALFHSCVVDPARPYHPQDKALVERSVTLVYQRIFYPLDKQTFFSLKELNVAIAEQLVLYNDYLFSHGGSTRRSQFIDLEKEHLSPLPISTYNLRYFKRAKVQKISHVYMSADRNYYSVPHRYIGHHVEVQYNNDTVEVFYNFQRIAKHQRSFRPGNYTTIGDHMPSSHQVYNDWSPMYFEQRAAVVGPSAQQYIRQLIAQYSYPELGYKQAQGILAFVKTHSAARVENACKRGLSHHKSSYQTIANILKNKLDTLEEEVQQAFHIPVHENLRDASIYR